MINFEKKTKKELIEEIKSLDNEKQHQEDLLEDLNRQCDSLEFKLEKNADLSEIMQNVGNSELYNVEKRMLNAIFAVCTIIFTMVLIILLVMIY